MDSIKDIVASIANASRPRENAIFARNSAYARPASVMTGYMTKLDPLSEMAFQQWIADNKVPFNDAPDGDYDMRGFYKSMVAGDGKANTGMNANDGQLHFTDYFKTPYHESFSAESKYAVPGAPQWNEQDQLETPGARIVFDERNRK
jgi:hypothetical protein